jgi:hypothetical protein
MHQDVSQTNGCKGDWMSETLADPFAHHFRWPVVVWAVVPIVIHGIAALGYKLTLEKRGSQKAMTLDEVQHNKTTHQYHLSTMDADKHTASSVDLVPSGSRNARPSPWFQREWISCASHKQLIHFRLPAENLNTSAYVGITLTCVAGFLSFFHLLYGTVTFSGLLFINSLDAISLVSMRLLASSIFCRAVVLFEIAAMRGALRKPQTTQ